VLHGVGFWVTNGRSDTRVWFLWGPKRRSDTGDRGWGLGIKRALHGVWIWGPKRRSTGLGFGDQKGAPRGWVLGTKRRSDTRVGFLGTKTSRSGPAGPP